MTYILPWGDVGETGATGIPNTMPIYAGPLKAVYEVAINKSAFTGKEIYRATDTTGEAAGKISDFMWKQAAPPMAPGGYGFERIRKAYQAQPDYFGRTTEMKSALASSLLGLKVNPVDVEHEGTMRKVELKRTIQDLKIQEYGVRRNQGLTREEKIEKIRALREKKRTLIENWKGEHQPSTGEPKVEPLPY
jgi:hypothetical protein